jgi:hypothetical protein
MKHSPRPFGCIVPHEDLRDLLSTVEKPGRYVGGEYGRSTVRPTTVISKFA